MKMRTKHNLVPALFFIALLYSSNTALCETTKTSFLGVITNIANDSGAILGSITNGQIINGYFTFSNDPTNHLGGDRYRATTAIFLPEVSFIINADTTYIRVKDNSDRYPYGVVDYFSHGFDSIGPLAENEPFYIYELVVEFIDKTTLLFSTNPTLPYVPKVSDFNLSAWKLIGKRTDTDQPFSISGKIVLTTVEDGPPWLFDSSFIIEPSSSAPLLSWVTTSGLTANIYFTTNLLNGTWQQIDSTPSINGTASTLTVPATNQSEYFRIIYSLD